MRNVVKGTISLATTLLLTAPFAARATTSAAASPSTTVADPCSSPLPIYLAAEGGNPANLLYGLKSGGNIFQLIEFPGGLRSDLTRLHAQGKAPLPLRGDSVGRFTFAAGKTGYNGPTHVFTHGAMQHVCFTGSVEAGRVQGSHLNGPMRTISGALDATIKGQNVTIKFVVGTTIHVQSGKLTKIHSLLVS